MSGDPKNPLSDDGPGAGDAPLGDILSSVLAEQERTETYELTLQQLAFFRKELRRMVAFLADTPGLGRTFGVRVILENVLDTATDLHHELLAKYELPSLAVARTVEMPIDEAGIGTSIEDEDTGPSTSVETLAASLEGLKDGVLVIRETLIASECVAELLATAPDFMREMARGELFDLSTTLSELIDKTLELVSMMPPETAHNAPPEHAPTLRAPRAPVAPSPPATLDSVVGVGGPAQNLSFETEATPFKAPPKPRGPVSVLLPPEDGVVARAPSAVQLPTHEPPAPSGPEVSGEESVRTLQEYFNANTPEGALLKAQEPEFARLVAETLVRVCPGVTVSRADLTARIKVLKDTFALRKKLRNTLTLREFRSLFGVKR